LKRLPPTRIFTCEVDAIRDPCIEFAVRLYKLGVDVKHFFLKSYVHGFANFDIKGFGIDEYSHGT
jgi:acetyl esterase/lipase